MAESTPIWVRLGWPTFESWYNAGRPSVPPTQAMQHDLQRFNRTMHVASSLMKGVLGPTKTDQANTLRMTGPAAQAASLRSHPSPALGGATRNEIFGQVRDFNLPQNSPDEVPWSPVRLPEEPEQPSGLEKFGAGVVNAALKNPVSQAIGDVPIPHLKLWTSSKQDAGIPVKTSTVSEIIEGSMQEITPLEVFQEYVEAKLEEIPVVGGGLGLLSELIMPTSPLDIVLSPTKLGVAGDLVDIKAVTKGATSLTARVAVEGGDIFSRGVRNVSTQLGHPELGAARIPGKAPKTTGGIPTDRLGLKTFLDDTEMVTTLTQAPGSVFNIDTLIRNARGANMSYNKLRTALRRHPEINLAKGSEADEALNKWYSMDVADVQQAVAGRRVKNPKEFGENPFKGTSQRIFTEEPAKVGEVPVPESLAERIAELDKLKAEEAERFASMRSELSERFSNVDELTDSQVEELAGIVKRNVDSGLESSSFNPIENIKGILDRPARVISKAKRAKSKVDDLMKASEEGVPSPDDFPNAFDEPILGDVPVNRNTGVAGKARPVKGKAFHAEETLFRGEGGDLVEPTSRIRAGVKDEKMKEWILRNAKYMDETEAKELMEKAGFWVSTSDDVTDIVLNMPHYGAGGAFGGGKIPYRDGSGAIIPDSVQAVTDDFIAARTGYIRDLSDTKNPMRRVAAFIAGENSDKQIDEIIRLQRDYTSIMSFANITSALRNGEALDTEQMLKRVNNMAKSVAEQIVNNVYAGQPDSVAKRAAAMEMVENLHKQSMTKDGLGKSLLQTQQLIKSMNLSADASVFGQQMMAALRRGNTALVSGLINSHMAKRAAAAADPMWFDSYRVAHVSKVVYLANRGLVVGNDDILKAAIEGRKATKTAADKWGKAGTALDKYQSVNQKLTEWQYGKVLAGARVMAAEGLFAQAEFLHRTFKKVPGLKGLAEGFNTQNPAVAFKLTQQANMIGSASRGASGAFRSALEDTTLLTPGMTRAQLAEIVSIFDVTSPAGLLNTVNLLFSYTGYMAGMMLGHYGGNALSQLAFGEPLTVSEFSYDPEDYGFGKSVFYDGRTMDWMAQATFYKAARRALNRGDQEGIMKAATELGVGRLNFLPGYGVKGYLGIGYAKEGGIIDQIFPQDDVALEFGWFGDNEWDNPLTWSQKIGTSLPIPPLSVGQAVGGWISGVEDMDLSDPASIASGVGSMAVDTATAFLGQAEYQESAFGAATRLSQKEYDTPFQDLPFVAKVDILEQMSRQGNEPDRGILINAYNTGVYGELWKTLQTEASGYWIDDAKEYDSLQDFQEKVIRDFLDTGVNQAIANEEANRIIAEMKDEFKSSTGKSFSAALKENQREVVLRYPEIGLAFATQRLETDPDSPLPDWLIEAYRDATGRDIRYEEGID